MFANYFFIYLFQNTLWHIENLYFFCLLIFSPTCLMDNNKPLHINLETLPVVLCRDPRCCQSHQVLRRTKVNLIITAYVGYDKRDFLCKSIPTWEQSYTTLSRSANNDWVIHIFLDNFHGFFLTRAHTHTHTFIYINKFFDDIYFFTLEKYRTLMIGPLWLCFSQEVLHRPLIKPETCFYTSTPLQNRIDKKRRKNRMNVQKWAARK